MGNAHSSAASRACGAGRKRGRAPPPHAESSRILFLLYLIHRTWSVVVEHVESKNGRGRGSNTAQSSRAELGRLDTVSLASDAGSIYSGCNCSYCRLNDCVQDCIRYVLIACESLTSTRLVMPPTLGDTTVFASYFQQNCNNL